MARTRLFGLHRSSLLFGRRGKRQTRQKRQKREGRRPGRRQRRAEKRSANEVYKRINAPNRIRRAAKACIVFGVLAVLGGFLSQTETPQFGGDAYTEMVSQLASINSSVAWLAAVVLFTSAALLKALADLLDALRRQTGGDSAGW